ncbi:MAG: Clp protease N-terminal domain-containing protein [Cyanobacteria bacterium J06650_10]
MFEYFSNSAINSIMWAQEEARRLGHNFVGTEQLLLGVIREDTGVAAKVIKSSTKITLENARKEVEKIIGRGSGSVVVEIPFTPRTKQVFEFSLREARQLKHDYVGTEHLLLGLLKEGEGVGARVLENLGVSSSFLRVQVIAALNGTAEASNSSIFKDFTNEAINVVSIAQEEARQIGGNFIGPEHLLLGLVGEEDGIAAEVLKSIKVTSIDIRAELSKLVDRNSDAIPSRILFTPKSKRILTRSTIEAKRLKHSFVGTEHLLLGLLFDSENIAIKILENLSIRPVNVRKLVLGKLLVPSSSSMTGRIKRVYKCSCCSHEIISVMRPSTCEICGDSSFSTLVT